MSLSDLASIATVVSSIAVLGSLIYLALQVRQTERNQCALIQPGRAARTAQSLMHMSEREIAEPFLKGMEGDETMSPVEQAQFRMAFSAMIISAEDSYFQYRQRLLSKQQFESVVNVLLSMLATAGPRAMWRNVESRFEDGFRDFINSRLRIAVGRQIAPSLSDWKTSLARARAEISARGNCQ
ncbi:MAG: hypothetical protein JSR81_13370 [Proteobacteria bacterium]|nr:hypothetical protein [Pseudomonadota bacterium]